MMKADDSRGKEMGAMSSPTFSRRLLVGVGGCQDFVVPVVRVLTAESRCDKPTVGGLAGVSAVSSRALVNNVG
jgi:hypothetical protein